MKHVIVDAGAIIKGVDLRGLNAELLITVPQVLAEIRDEEARRRLDTMAVKLETRIPSKEAMMRVINFAHKTGDYAVLSPVDIQVIALTLMLEMEYSGGLHLRENPIAQTIVFRPPVGRGVSEEEEEGGDVVYGEKDVPTTVTTNDGGGEVEKNATVASSSDDGAREGTDLDGALPHDHDHNHDGDHDRGNDNDDNNNNNDGFTVVTSGSSRRKPPKSNLSANPLLPGWGTKEWASTDNIAQMQDAVPTETVGPEPADDALMRDDTAGSWGVFCLTSDFAMQNVLIQMGLQVASVEGRKITRVKQWALRCFSCFKITRDMSKVFCPTCGNNTLKRVSISVDSAGTVMAFFNPKYRISTRGTKYTVPKPVGGRGPKFITDEAQLPKPRPSDKKKETQEYLFGDPRNRPAEKPKIEWGGKNPNANRKKGHK